MIAPQPSVTGFAATMTTIGMGLGSAVTLGDLRVVATNISLIRNDLQFSPGATIFVSSLATLTLAASVLGAGVLGDRFGMRRMFLCGAFGAVAFGLLGAAAPNVVVLMIARAGNGLALAFLSSLSLGIMNAVFPPERRAGAIARYLAAVYAFGVVPATAGGLLAERISWRAGLLVTPALAIAVVVITHRYVPETHRSHRRIDIPGLLLVAVALLGLTYGISRLQSGVDAGATAAILAGGIAATAFVWWELRCDDPALDLRIFRSRPFTAVVAAGAANNLVQGGATVMATFYLVTIRGTSTWAFALLLIPATLLSAPAALWAGRAAARFGNGVVVVAGLAMLGASLVMRLSFGIATPIAFVAAVMVLMAMSGAVVQTPQTTVMMSSAPVELGGVVSALKTSVAGTFYGFGSALSSMFGIILFKRDAGPMLADTGISAEQAGVMLGARGEPGDAVLDPAVVSQAVSSMLDTAHTLNLIMLAIPVLAAVATGVLFRTGRSPHDSRPAAPSGDRPAGEANSQAPDG